MTQIDNLKLKIPYDVDIFENDSNYNVILNQLLEDSKYITLSLLYPFEDYYNMDLPLAYNNWQLRCCVELYNLADKAGFSNYSENGLSFQKLSDGLSTQLLSQIIASVGVPKENRSGYNV